MAMDKDYSEIVRKCFTRGEPDWKDWDDYRDLGFSAAHIPELIHILDTTSELWDEAGQDDRIEWAPIHAWRALAQLGAVEALPAMLRLLEKEGDSDWVTEDIPQAAARLGPAAVEDLRDLLCSPGNDDWARIGAARALQLIAEQHPERRGDLPGRPDCIAALCAGLELFEQNDETVNGFIISYLADANAPETAGLVERAFQSGRVDLSIMGDYEEFQIAVGLLKERITPPPRHGWFQPDIRRAFVQNEAQKRRRRQSEKKEKAKRKQEKLARKRHRRK